MAAGRSPWSRFGSPEALLNSLPVLRCWSGPRIQGVRWTKRDAVLHGYVDASDSLAALRQLTCPACESRFDSVVLHLDDLTFADSDGLQALGTYCGEMDDRGGSVSIRTDRPALQRLLLTGPLGAVVDTDPGDDSGPGEPHT